MEYFFNVNTGKVEQRPVEQQFYSGTTVPLATPFSSNQEKFLPNMAKGTAFENVVAPVPFTSASTNFQDAYYLPENKITPLGFDTTYGVANEPDVEQVDSLGTSEESGIMKLLKFLRPGSILESILPDPNPQALAMRNFYGSQFGLTPTGQVASGIMKGYNPVYGGFLNMITGGKFGKPTQYGLAGAMQRRIENILGRKAPQTDASRKKVAELRRLQLAEIEDRAAGGESMSSIGKSTFSGPGMAFAPKTDTYSGGKVVSSSSVPGGKYGSPK